MGALVMNDADFASGIAHQDHGLAADEAAEIVAGNLYLALVTDINPGDAEDALKLKLEYGRIGVDLPVHTAGLNEARKVLLHRDNTPVFPRSMEELSHAALSDKTRRRSFRCSLQLPMSTAGPTSGNLQ
jgi:hypothetical protein